MRTSRVTACHPCTATDTVTTCQSAGRMPLATPERVAPAGLGVREVRANVKLGEEGGASRVQATSAGVGTSWYLGDVRVKATCRGREGMSTCSAGSCNRVACRRDRRVRERTERRFAHAHTCTEDPCRLKGTTMSVSPSRTDRGLGTTPLTSSDGSRPTSICTDAQAHTHKAFVRNAAQPFYSHAARTARCYPPTCLLLDRP
jgi:hypothetical protein